MQFPTKKILHIGLFSVLLLPASLALAKPAPESADPAFMSEAETLLNQGEWNKAIRLANRRLSRNSKSWDAWTVSGRAYLGKKQYAWAVRRFNKALKFRPAYADAFYWKGQAFEEWGKLDEATNEYQAAIHADAQQPLAQAALGRLTTP